MQEGLKINDNSREEFIKTTYEDYRKEILGFKDLPDSTFNNVKDNMGTILETKEAKKRFAHEIMQKIDNEARNGLFNQQLHFELVHLWEKEILGRKEKRTMYDNLGNVIES